MGPEKKLETAMELVKDHCGFDGDADSLSAWHVGKDVWVRVTYRDESVQVYVLNWFLDIVEIFTRDWAS